LFHSLAKTRDIPTRITTPSSPSLNFDTSNESQVFCLPCFNALLTCLRFILVFALKVRLKPEEICCYLLVFHTKIAISKILSLADFFIAVAFHFRSVILL